LEDLYAHEKIILEGILNSVRTCGLDSSIVGYGTVVGTSENGNEHSVSSKGGEFLD
jgi:hypothetical protein